LLGSKIYGEQLPKGAINYIWANRLPRGESINNPYTKMAKMVAVESGSEKVGQWVSEERNVYRDYRALFGDEPPQITGIAIMTDTDKTRGKALAYYEGISFCRS
jgi:hypothetical protein